jgi:very-short-patch-repair endonuclease
MHDYQNIICKIHGIFNLPLHWHINKGRGCKQCALDNRTDTKYKFINKANNIHNFKYNYDKVDYITCRKKVIITCLIHGDFTQKPRDHINNKQGCPICKESKGELLVSNILTELNIKFDRQKSFTNLKYKYLLYFDFYLPDYNICIEYDGEQHFRSIEYWGGDKQFEIIKLRDNLKSEYCKDNNINLLRLKYGKSEIKENIINFLNIK